MKAPAVPAEKLKYLALVFAIATIGITAALIIVTLIDGLFNLGYITTCIAPVLLNVFIIIVKEDTKKVWVTHPIGYIVLYVFFCGWSLSGVWMCINLILNIATIFTSLTLILLTASQITYTLDGLVGLLYYHNYRTTVVSEGNGQPLLNQA